MENLKILNCQSKKIYIMCGIPGSGKSTWAKAQATNKSKYVSRDVERFKILGDNDAFFSKEKQVFSNFVKEIEDGIENYEEVYVDATHINKPSRAKILRALNKYAEMPNIEIIAVYMDTPFELCLERNKLREGRAKVPYDQMESINQYKSKPRELEGFDKIMIIKGE